MQTISGEQKEIIDLLDSMCFIDGFYETILKPVCFVIDTGDVKYNYIDFLNDKQLIELKGKGKKNYNSFVIKMNLDHHTLTSMEIQTSFFDIFNNGPIIRKRYKDIINIEFFGEQFINVRKNTEEFTLSRDGSFHETKTQNQQTFESYQGKQRIYKKPNPKLVRTL